MSRSSDKPPATRRPRKQDLPAKLCAACNKPFAWRKKWERDWEHVRYCSDRCRAAGKAHITPPKTK